MTRDRKDSPRRDDQAAPDAVDIRHEAQRIDGAQIDHDGLGRVDILNPYTGARVGTVPRAGPDQVARAFAAADAFCPDLSRHQRRCILERTATAIDTRKDAIADLITAESGLCKKDALYECERAFDVFTLAAQLCIVDDGAVFACDLTARGQPRKIFTQRQPLRGAISAITPFNHPLNMVAHKIAPAIATNNRMVCKPADLTPLTCLMLADILYQAGLPPAMFQVVTGLPDDIGAAMITDPRIDLITFTGSVAVGKSIAAMAGYRRTVLELGGNSPLIIMDDADPERAAAMAVAGATKNSGQRCTAVKRVLVHKKIAAAITPLIVKKAAALKCGDPTDPETDIGTVIHAQAAKTLERRVAAALADGAVWLHGGLRCGALFPPTVIDQVPVHSELVREETFGPVIPIIHFRDIDEAITIANATVFGLSAGVCTNRLDDIDRFVNELDHGTVNIWEVPGFRTEMSPFGGIKDSGLGYKEGLIEAMKSFTNVKTFSLPWGRTRNARW